ncbi:MAG: L-threonine 3-dehydrogenase [Gammaproteobacteria bacterium]|nr:L-threonine 3-dehydrogenase [Gammaproteobacteria bacterium]
MKALVKQFAGPGITMVDKPIPIVGPKDVLVKIEKTAICGTDMHIYHWDEWAAKTIPVPMTIGHEFYGKIFALGQDVSEFQIGQRVSGEGHVVCGQCLFCRTGRAHLCPDTKGIGVNIDGAFAEYLLLPASNVISLPDALSDEVSAILDPFGNATHTALSFNLVGEDVLITGAGPIGMMAVAVARHAGARRIVITDVNPYRLELAKTMGADIALNIATSKLTDAMKTLDINYGFSFGMEMSGNPQAFSDMIHHLQAGAGLALLGIPPQHAPVDWHQIIFKCIRIQGIYGRKMYDTWYKMMAMLQSGLNLKPIITHQFSYANYQDAFECMASGQSGKVLIDWT